MFPPFGFCYFRHSGRPETANLRAASSPHGRTSIYPASIS